MYKPKRTFKRVKIVNMYLGNGVSLDEDGIPRHACVECGGISMISSEKTICRYCEDVNERKRKYMRNWR